jgi:glutamate racemase
MDNNQPIGILTQALAELQYGKRFTICFPMKKPYLADSKNAPYGKKSKRRDCRLEYEKIPTLLLMNCKLIVVACNTATTNAIRELRANMTFFYGIEPAIKPAARIQNKKDWHSSHTGTLIVNFSIKPHNSFKTQNYRPGRLWISAAYRKRKMYSTEMTELLHSI